MRRGGRGFEVSTKCTITVRPPTDEKFSPRGTTRRK
nr:MAG TPA_asm: hypothetical protein [Caudoviricetes sp.]DAQ15504.1 MAG TPA: hypothetical protein [Caudoviricetes sp.]